MKLLGVLLFLSATALLTAYSSKHERRKYEEAEGLYLLLLHVKHGVFEGALPLSEIYASFENEALAHTPFLVLLKKEGLTHALKECPLPIDEDAKRSLVLYAEGLGKRFFGEEKQAAEKACEAFAQTLEKYRHELPARLKIRRTLLLCGSGMALLLFL